MNVKDHDKDISTSQDHDFAKRRCRGGLGAYLSRNVENYLTSIPIILCCFCSGLIDSSVFNAWGVFATMQTGMIYKELWLVELD